MVKKYFSKDWKFFWRYDSIIGNIYGVILNRLGLLFLTIGRKMIRRGGGSFAGKFYSNCSWCGAEQTVSTGLHMHCSRKGSRCGIRNKDCHDQPFV